MQYIYGYEPPLGACPHLRTNFSQEKDLTRFMLAIVQTIESGASSYSYQYVGTPC